MMYSLKFPNGKMVEWAMQEGGQWVRTAPLLFHTKQDAIDFRQRVARDGKLKPSQTGKCEPCWIYQDGQYHWEGKLRHAEVVGKAKPGPIRHQSLEPKWEQVCRDLYPIVGKYINSTYEQWELGFLRDANPDKELAVWQSIATAFTKYCNEHPDCDKKKLVADLVGLTFGVENETTAVLKPYYDGIIKPLSIQAGNKPIKMKMVVGVELAARMPQEEIRKLAMEWVEKAMHREVERMNTVWTKWGEVVVLCDFEECGIYLALANECD
jgi:hypothetical protein